MHKQYIEVPLQVPEILAYKLWLRFKGALLSPVYLLLAIIIGVPGISFYLRSVIMGVKLLFAGKISFRECYYYVFCPMDSTRYFEFDEVGKSLKNFSVTRYLDVSSPRLMPLFLLDEKPIASAMLINPDLSDLRDTERLANALSLQSRCEFFNGVLDGSGVEPESFDLITCVSVLEHIPQDKNAVGVMWKLLRPSGKLILTLPCRAEPLEQYISHNQYGVLTPENDGYTFWQRYYTEESLRDVVFPITGLPSKSVVYGEKLAGLFYRNASMKRLMGANYPFWREPYMMAVEYRYFNAIRELPGEGVVMLEFIKK